MCVSVRLNQNKLQFVLTRGKSEYFQFCALKTKQSRRQNRNLADFIIINKLSNFHLYRTTKKKKTKQKKSGQVEKNKSDDEELDGFRHKTSFTKRFLSSQTKKMSPLETTARSRHSIPTQSVWASHTHTDVTTHTRPHTPLLGAAGGFWDVLYSGIPRRDGE